MYSAIHRCAQFGYRLTKNSAMQIVQTKTHMGILLSLSSSHTLVYEKSLTCMKRNNNNNILQQSRSICSRTAGAGSAKRHGMVRTGTALSLWRDQRPGHGGTAPRQTGESGGGVPRRLCLCLCVGARCMRMMEASDLQN